MKKWVVIGLVVALFGTGFTFKTWRGQLTQGNRELEKGQPDAAIAAYQEGLVNAPDEPLIHYNLGNAFYEKGDFAKAGEHFKKALDLGLNTKLQSQAEYNLGNALYRQGAGLEAEKPEEAIKQYETSLTHFKNVIQADSEDLDAKYNYEFVKKKLDELKEKMKDQQNDQKNDEDQKDQKDDQQDSKQNDSQDKDQQDSKQNDSQDKDQQDQQQDDSQSKDDQNQQQNDSQSKDQQDQNQEDQKQDQGNEQNTQQGQNSQSDPQTGTSGQDQQAAGTEDGQGMTQAQALQLLEQFQDQGGQLIPIMPENEDGAPSHKNW